ncbi:xenotropic and polytropic retrovirus receptor 1 homolog [Ictalurus punctatus]|uniref:Xenotropic and polytropic retrovirus receptor 1 homolog n=1 Tax=Ictalurus punctatus TaxID=7998 RepID=A0A2D0PND1_ICTPU|nr:xenotropic and polytropic retrovirus receptor 1 homolog [Ictalurus punctatus]
MPVTHICFSEYLTAHMIPEWRKQYICYEELNSILTREHRQHILFDKQSHHFPICEEFLEKCDTELKKVNLFYSEKLSEAKWRLSTLGIVALDGSGVGMGESGHVPVSSEAYRHLQRKKTELHKLKMAVGDFYLSLAFLQSYQELNYQGFYKITKKYDAKLPSERGLQWRTERLDTSLLHTERHSCEEMMFRLETFMLQLEGGNEEKALRRLELPQRGMEQTAGQWITFRIGVTCGLIIALITFIAFKASNESHLENLKSLLQLYRGSFLLIEFLSLMGLIMYCWRRSGINHILIFELDPRHHLSHHHVLEVAGYLAVCCCISVLAWLHPSFMSIPQQLHPLLFHSLLLLLLLNPTSICHSWSRRWFLAVMWKVLTAPLWPVGFADCWLADQLNSLGPLILSLWDLLCFYIFQINWADLQDGSSLIRESEDWERQSKVVICLIQCFPPWLRFAQCLRHFWDSGNTVHLLNAGKYSTVFLMVTFASLYNTAREKSDPAMEESVYVYMCLWAISTCISVIVTVSWDLRMDWGLLQGNGLLKEELLYSREVYYYAAMLADVLLRISWAINILLAQMKDSAAVVTVSAILAPLEVLRRSIWNFFRLENEHLKNCRQCRAIRDFDLPASPINLPQKILIEKLKDPNEQIIGKQETSASHRKPTCLLLRYLRSRVKETNLPVGSPEMEST